MNHLELWKLATDVLLLGALMHLCFQFVRSPRISSASRQLRELEGALRTLIREADGAGRTLNEQLMHRQQSLEKILIDAQLAEQRISQAARSTYSEPEVARPAARAEKSVPEYERNREMSAAPVRSEMPSQTQTLEPASFPALPSMQDTSENSDEDESTITFGETNIYGEPIERKPALPVAPTEPVIGRARRKAMETYTPLSAKIEKEVAPSAKRKQRSSGSVEDIYASAEQLLRAGNDLMAVAARTKLPIEEVRALSQMIIGERAVAETEAKPTKSGELDDDPRLGVMAKMKRQTITL